MFVSSSIAGETSGELSGNRSAPEEQHPLTVLQIVPRLDMGGVERGTLEITEAITRAGGRALVATAGGRLLPRVIKAGGEVIAMNVDTRNPLNLWQNARLLARLIEDLQIDIVHARSRAPAWSAYWATQRTGAHFITTYHGAYREDLVFKRRYNEVMARGRPVIAVSDFIRRLIIERHQVAPERIVTIPRGADIKVFAEETVGNERTVKLAQQWGLLDDPRPVIMLPARLSRWKGAEDLIDAADRLRAMRGDDFLILLVGEDGGNGFEAVLRKRIGKLGVGGIVHLAGGCADMAAAYKLASVVVSASTEPEAFGRAVVEAQAMGRPVIATGHGGAQETVAHGSTGWLYPPGDIARLTIELNKALNLDPSGRAHMGLAARARVHSRYTVAAMQRATLEVYEGVAGRTFAKLV
ncbi:MAG: glycosyltransferase family 4 protein [Proteobacteria bacterium]|nr:glycosyltransferase family 4 protein [Pseudomonadota bacterium]